jgi:hypothetical protein
MIPLVLPTDVRFKVPMAVAMKIYLLLRYAIL